MAALGNVLWHIPFLGFLNALVSALLGLMFFASLVGAPLATGLMALARFFLAPFGHRLINARDLGGAIWAHPLWRVWGWLVMVIWLPVGVILAFATAVQCVLLCLTVVGVPAALALAKAIPALFNPVGKKCVPTAMADELLREKTRSALRRKPGTGDPRP